MWAPLLDTRAYVPPGGVTADLVPSLSRTHAGKMNAPRLSWPPPSAGESGVRKVYWQVGAL